MGIQNKLTFQFDNQASFKLDGNTIDLGKMATDQVVLGKDGKEETIKGFFCASLCLAVVPWKTLTLAVVFLY